MKSKAGVQLQAEALSRIRARFKGRPMPWSTGMTLKCLAGWRLDRAAAEEIATAAGITVEHLRRYEANEIPMSLEMFETLCPLYGHPDPFIVLLEGSMTGWTEPEWSKALKNGT